MTTYTGMTGDKMVLQVRSMVGEAQPGFLTDDDIIRWLNLAQLELAQRTGLLVSEAESTSVASQKKYGLKDDFMEAVKVWYAEDQLRYRGLHELTAMYSRSDLNTEGTPQEYYLMSTADSGLCLFLRPVPAVTGDEIATWYRARPDVLTASSSSTSLIRPEFHMALCHWAAAQARKKRREYRESRDELVMYEGYVQRAESFARNPQKDRPPHVLDHQIWDQSSVGEDPTIQEL